MSDDKYPRVWQTNLIANLTGIFFRAGAPSPARYEESRNGNLKVVPADAIVIERSELPPVTDSSDDPDGTVRADAKDGQEYGGTWVRPGVFRDPEAMCRSHVVEYLALGEYFREHPPVDPALVEQIRDLALAADVTLSGTQVDTIARYFATRGVRVTEDGAR